MRCHSDHTQTQHIDMQPTQAFKYSPPQKKKLIASIKHPRTQLVSLSGAEVYRQPLVHIHSQITQNVFKLNHKTFVGLCIKLYQHTE